MIASSLASLPVATTYPLWFGLLARAFVLFPIYPGLAVGVAGLILKIAKRPAAPWVLAVGGAPFAAGAIVIALHWDSITSGNPYHFF